MANANVQFPAVPFSTPLLDARTGTIAQGWIQWYTWAGLAIQTLWNYPGNSLFLGSPLSGGGPPFYRAIAITDLPNVVAAHTITLAKLTALGTNGSISWNTKGLVIGWTDPT